MLVTATHVPLGAQVLARGIVFIDLAIAQIAGCGVLLADRLGFEAEGVAVQIAALAAALAGALLLTWTERRWPDVQEAVIGVVFVLAATGGDPAPRRATCAAASICATCWWDRSFGRAPAIWLGSGRLRRRSWRSGSASRQRLGRIGFYAIFACAVTVSVQLVGLYLVFATLIVPPLATRHMKRHRLTAAWALGARDMPSASSSRPRSTCRAARLSSGCWWGLRWSGMRRLGHALPRSHHRRLDPDAMLVVSSDSSLAPAQYSSRRLASEGLPRGGQALSPAM